MDSDAVPSDELTCRKGSTQEVDQCAPCKDNGQFSVPVAFCIHCKAFLCRKCLDEHKQFWVSKKHKILEGKNMYQQTPTAKMTQKCTKHADRIIALYCPSHDTVGCLICFKEEHTTCLDTGLISELSRDIEKSSELTEVRRMASQHEEVIESYRKHVQDYHAINKNCYDESVDKFHSFRSEIEASLEALGQKVLKEATELRERNQKVLDSLLKEMTSLAEELKSSTSDMELKQCMKQNENLFIDVKTNKKKIIETGQKLDRIKKMMQIKRYGFSGNPSIKHILNASCITEIGELRCTADIKVKFPDDKNKCIVRGMEKVSATDIVVADDNEDQGYECLKQINVVQNTLVCKRVLESSPVDMTTIPESRVAVTMPHLNQIQLFSLDGTLTPCGKIGVDGRCLGIDCTGNRLLVSYKKPGKLQMIDLNGKVLMTVTSDAAGNPLFEKPKYLSVSPDHRSIYVSDADKHTVTCLDMDGTVNWIYQAEDLKGPRGVVTGPDKLYICSAETHLIHVVSPGGGKLAIIPTKQYKFSWPLAIYYCSQEEALYVSSRIDGPKGNFIKRLTWN